MTIIGIITRSLSCKNIPSVLMQKGFFLSYLQLRDLKIKNARYTRSTPCFLAHHMAF